MQDREISPSGSEFQPGTRQASSLVEIPTPRVRFPYPTWTLMTDCYNLKTSLRFPYLGLNPIIDSITELRPDFTSAS